MLPHIINGNGTISIMIDGTMKPIDNAHKNYDAIKEALKSQNWDLVPDLVNIVEQVEQAINESTVEAGTVTIKDGEVFYNDTVIHNSLTDRIVAMAKDGFDIGHMVKFLENLMENPSYRAVNELYSFLEAGSIPITENGTFLSYKKITSEWKDIYTGKIDNSVGATVTMARNMVNEDSQQTCSAGLHVCSYDYLPSFGSSGGDRVVICEINPKDVVSIPADYNNTKMRCCAYTVIGEVTDYKNSNVLAEKAVVDTNDVQTGNVCGTVDHSSVGAKQIGKMIENELDDGEISTADLCSILGNMNVNPTDIDNIKSKADDGMFKRVGKKIAKLINVGTINAQTLEDEVMTSKAQDGAPTYHDDEEGETCGRCGADLEGDDECPDCGYYNN